MEAARRFVMTAGSCSFCAKTVSEQDDHHPDGALATMVTMRVATSGALLWPLLGCGRISFDVQRELELVTTSERVEVFASGQQLGGGTTTTAPPGIARALNGPHWLDGEHEGFIDVVGGIATIDLAFDTRELIAVGFVSGNAVEAAVMHEMFPVRAELVPIGPVTGGPIPPNATNVVVWGDSNRCVLVEEGSTPSGRTIIVADADYDCDDIEGPTECDRHWYRRQPAGDERMTNCARTDTVGGGLACVYGGPRCTDGVGVEPGCFSLSPHVCRPDAFCGPCSGMTISQCVAGNQIPRMSCQLPITSDGTLCQPSPLLDLSPIIPACPNYIGLRPEQFELGLSSRVSFDLWGGSASFGGAFIVNTSPCTIRLSMGGSAPPNPPPQYGLLELPSGQTGPTAQLPIVLTTNVVASCPAQGTAICQLVDVGVDGMLTCLQ